jgi:FkbM family methyltransferase
MTSVHPAKTTVIDAGARYGIHPSWADFGGDLLYLAFEPDEEEVRNLKAMYQEPWYEVIPLALSRDGKERTLHVTRHRGLSSFLEADTEGDFYKWYMRSRHGAGEVEYTVRVKTRAIDDLVAERGLSVDFLKVDTEGTELEVMEGASRVLETSALGVRASTSFQPFFKDQALFSHTHDFLISKGFFLLNLDYQGYGDPRNCLFRKPDPLAREDVRYGVLLNSDGVWLKYFDRVQRRFEGDPRGFAFAALKYAYFCLLNDASDLAIDTLLSYKRDHGGEFDPAVQDTKLYRALRRACAKLLGRWRVYPDAQWTQVREMFQAIFGLELLGGSGYWQQIRSL